MDDAAVDLHAPVGVATVPILTFHDLADDRAPIAFDPAGFAALMHRLHDRGWRTMPLADLARRIALDEPLPPRRFVVSFDDGYASVADHALPVFERLELTATLFLSVGAGNEDGAAEPASMEGRPMLRWEQVQSLSRCGWEIAAHGLTHHDLTTLDDDEVAAEVVGSSAAITRRIGTPPPGFSYPYGRYDSRVRSIVAPRTGFAVSDRLGFAGSGSDPFALERVEMYYFRRRPLDRIVGTRAFAAAVRAINGPRRLRRVVHDRRSTATTRPRNPS